MFTSEHGYFGGLEAVTKARTQDQSKAKRLRGGTVEQIGHPIASK
jgi:hypothetical protein